MTAENIPALIERLRTKVKHGLGCGEAYPTLLREAADALTALTTPPGDMETTAEERAAWTRSGRGTGIYRACIDIDRLSAQLAALREKHPEPEGVVEEPPRDNSITDAW